MSSETIRILVVDDDPGDFQMAKAMILAIENPEIVYEVEWVSSYEEAIDALQDAAHDIYLIDYFLEDRDGLDVVREARAHGIRRPMIMLTGRGSHQVDLDAMKAGASDYLVKGRIDPDQIERTLRYALERYRDQEALRESEERHRGMFDHLPIGLYRCSPEGSFVDANPALVRLLGHPDAEALRARYARGLYVGAGDLARFRNLLEEEGIVRAFETTLERVDGSRVSVRHTARAHRGPDGVIEYIEGAVEDVSDLQSAATVRGDAATFEAVFRHSRQPMLLLDGSGRVTHASPAFLRAFDHDLDRIVGQPFTELVADGDRGGASRALEALGVGGGAEGGADSPALPTDPVVSERQLLGGGGEILWTRTVSARVQGHGGGPAPLIVLFHDVEEAATVDA